MNPIRVIIRLARFCYREIYRRIDPVGFARRIGVKVGNNCRLINVNFGSEPYLVSLGNHVSATRTNFITHDGSVWVLRHQKPEIDLIAPINVGNNVFLGINVIILPGVTIGDNVVIGAGAVVTRDIPSHCVAAGVPARPIKSLEEFLQKADAQGLPTKKMSENQKREFLIKHFGINV